MSLHQGLGSPFAHGAAQLAPSPSSTAGESVAAVLVRVYKTSVQRLPCDLSNLSSKAAYVLIVSAVRRCFVWIGNVCSPVDRTIAENLAYDILRDDFQTPSPTENIECMQEDREIPSILQSILDAMWARVDDYRRAAHARANNQITNYPATLCKIVRADGVFVLTNIASTPVGSNGSVDKLEFPNLLTLEKNAVLCMMIGDQYDVWANEGVGRRELSAIKVYLTHYAMGKVPEKRRGLEAVLFARSLKIATDSDKTLFRAHFTAESSVQITFRAPKHSRVSFFRVKGRG
jgi:hypothetical protein